MTTLADHLVEARASFKKHERNFQKTFGFSLRQYWHPLFGFDVVKFDDKFLIPRFRYEDEKTSMSDCVRKEFGKEAEVMIRELI